MDFTLDEEIEEVRGLAADIFAGRAATDRVREVENSATRLDEELWTELGKAGLLGIALPEDVGGAGLGAGALCVLLEEQGRRVAPVPVWPNAVGALAIALDGTPQQRARLLPGMADGSARCTVAFEEFGAADPVRPGCTARCTESGTPPRPGAGGGWRLTGTKAVVPSPFGAAYVLVAATAETGTGLFLVDPAADGVVWEQAETTGHDLSGNLTLHDVAAEPVGAPGDGTLDRAVDRARTAVAALQLGVVQGAVAHAVTYLSEREQFGRPLATFQAVQQLFADCYIDTDALRVCLWQAVAAIDAGEPATRAALVAKWWAADAGLTIVHRVQHLHGGIGVDVDYPVHRHFLWGKQLAGTLGSAGADLAALGTELAGPGAEPDAETHGHADEGSAA